MQNLARFRTTSKFGGEYLRNEWRYSKSDSYSVYRDSSSVRQNKSGEVWSSDLGDLDVKSYPSKAHISEEHILAPNGRCAPPKFLHALENDQVLLAHPAPETQALLTIFFKRWSKIGLKCSVLAARTLEPNGVALWNLATWRAARWGDKRVQLLGGTVPLKFGRAKNVQNLVRFTTTFESDRTYLWTE